MGVGGFLLNCFCNKCLFLWALGFEKSRAGLFILSRFIYCVVFLLLFEGSREGMSRCVLSLENLCCFCNKCLFLSNVEMCVISFVIAVPASVLVRVFGNLVVLSVREHSYRFSCHFQAEKLSLTWCIESR